MPVAGYAGSGTANATITFQKGDADQNDMVSWDTAGWTSVSGTTFSKTGDYGNAIFDTSTGVVSYTLDNNSAASDALKTGDKVHESFEVKVHDISGATAIANAVFDIKGRNDALVAVDDTLSYTKNTVAHYAASELLANDSDIDSSHSALTIAKVKSGTGGTVKLGSHNTVIFTPARDFEGDAYFSYIATDGKASSQAVTVTLSIPAPADTTAPDAPTMSLDLDSGVSGTDGITNASAYTIVSEPGATLEYRTSLLSGSWGGTAPAIGSDGDYTIYVRQTDLAGNISLPSEELSITLDRVAPALTSSSTDNPVDIADDIVLTFSEAVYAGSGDIRISHASGSQTIPITDTSRVTISGSNVTIHIPEGLVPNTDHWISMDSGVLTDTAGNATAEILPNPVLPFNAMALVPISGDAGDNTLIGSARSESITGGGGFDVILGNGGNDRIIVPDLNFDTVDGGEGNDTLALSGADIDLKYILFQNTETGNKINSIEVFDLTGSGNNTLDIYAEDLFRLSRTSLPLRVNGNQGDNGTVGDKLILTSNLVWGQEVQRTYNDVTYNVWSHFFSDDLTATVLVAVGVEFQVVPFPI